MSVFFSCQNLSHVAGISSGGVFHLGASGSRNEGGGGVPAAPRCGPPEDELVDVEGDGPMDEYPWRGGVRGAQRPQSTAIGEWCTLTAYLINSPLPSLAGTSLVLRVRCTYQKRRTSKLMSMERQRYRVYSSY